MAWEHEHIIKFDESADVVLRRCVPGAAALDAASFKELRDMWIMSFMAFSPDVQDGDVGPAVQRFEAYIRLLIPWDMEKRVSVSFKLGRNYGAQYVEFGFTDMSQPGQPAMKAATDRLIKTVLSEHDDYSARYLAGAQMTGPAVNGGEGERKRQPTQVLVDEGNRIDFEVKNGKKGYSIKCGKWQKFGVRIWPETLAASGINEADIPIEGLDIGPTDVHYTMKSDGQFPDKVIKLERRG